MWLRVYDISIYDSIPILSPPNLWNLIRDRRNIYLSATHPKVPFPLIFPNTLADKDLAEILCRAVSRCAGFVPLSIRVIERATCHGKICNSSGGYY